MLSARKISLDKDNESSGFLIFFLFLKKKKYTDKTTREKKTNKIELSLTLKLKERLFKFFIHTL